MEITIGVTNVFTPENTLSFSVFIRIEINDKERQQGHCQSVQKARQKISLGSVDLDGMLNEEFEVFINMDFRVGFGNPAGKKYQAREIERIEIPVIFQTLRR